MTITGSGQIGADDALSRMSALIASGDFIEGDRLPSERALAEMFGISRPAVREALRVLETQGLVSIVPGRGTYVAAPSAADMMGATARVLRGSTATARHVLSARKMLECHTARLAAESATEQDIESMEAAVDAFESASDLLERATADLAFHARLSKAAQNPVLHLMFSAIAPHLFDLMLRSTDLGSEGPAARLHREILEAIRAGDPDEAEALTAQHADVAYVRYEPYLDIPLSEASGKSTDSFGAIALRGRSDLVDAIVRSALES